MVAIVQIVLEITSLARLTGGWLVLSSAKFISVETWMILMMVTIHICIVWSYLFFTTALECLISAYLRNQFIHLTDHGWVGCMYTGIVRGAGETVSEEDRVFSGELAAWWAGLSINKKTSKWIRNHALKEVLEKKGRWCCEENIWVVVLNFDGWLEKEASPRRWHFKLKIEGWEGAGRGKPESEEMSCQGCGTSICKGCELNAIGGS